MVSGAFEWSWVLWGRPLRGGFEWWFRVGGFGLSSGWPRTRNTHIRDVFDVFAGALVLLCLFWPKLGITNMLAG